VRHSDRCDRNALGICIGIGIPAADAFAEFEAEVLPLLLPVPAGAAS
jgi:hypothetical protein